MNGRKNIIAKQKKWEPSGDQTSFVRSHQNTIKTTIEPIRRLDNLSREEQMTELDLMFPTKNGVSNDDIMDLIK